MAQSGPVILVDDDPDDERMLQDVLTELGVKNPLVYFSDTDEALAYLVATSQRPFLIFSDVNMPKRSGIEFKRLIDQHPELRVKSIPFVFFSTAANRHAVNEAYQEMTVQGFFTKPASFHELVNTIRIIVNYWELCHHPND
ncbi:MAG: response regulator [Chitinophagaceae bacterium]|nr:response regulator [Chitinophagaceae bacterium]